MAGIDYVIVFAFFVLIFAAGAYFYRWIGDADDFYVAGRRLTPFILAATLTATNVNLYSFVSQAGEAHAEGISIIWHTWTGNMALVLAGLFIIPVLRRLRVRTIPEFLEIRYGRSARMVTAAVIFIRLSFWLGIVVSVAVTAAQAITGLYEFNVGGTLVNSWHFWVFAFAVIAVVYTVLGGMWSVALTDTLQFILMMAGALIVLPLVMRAIGWWPGLVEQIPRENMLLVSPAGKFNWFFTLAIMFLGIQWASTDQGLIQRSFSARNTVTVARGMVLAGIVTTPFAFLWVLPGLASRVYLGEVVAQDSAIPLMLARLLPAGVLGVVVCGFLASQMSTIDSNLSAAATLFVNDIYGRFHREPPSSRHLLWAVRIVTGLAGVFMIAFSYIAAGHESGVRAYLGLMAIMDMPLFIVAIVYGFFWRRANLPGALVGYFAGALGGVVTVMLTRVEGGGLLSGNTNLATFISAGTALLACFVTSMLSKAPPRESFEAVSKAKHSSEEETETGAVYHIWPASLGGKACIVVLGLSFLVFLVGTVIGRTNGALGSLVALLGMVAFFVAGLVRLAFD